MNALQGKDDHGQRVEMSRWELASNLLEKADEVQVGFLYETLTAHPDDFLTRYFHGTDGFEDDADGAHRLALLNIMERRLGHVLTTDRSSFRPAPAGSRAKPRGLSPAASWQAKRASAIHQRFLFALQGLNAHGRPVPGQSRWTLARKVIEDEPEPAHVGYLYETLTKQRGDWLYQYFHSAAAFADDKNGQKRMALLDQMRERAGLPAPSSPPSPVAPASAPSTLARRPPETLEHLGSTTDPSWGFTYRVGDAAACSVLLDIVRGPEGLRLRWFNFHTSSAITGTADEWRILNLAGAFVPLQASYQKLGSKLSADEWRALWPAPVPALLARYEAKTLDIEDEVVVDIYQGLVFQVALGRLEQNEAQVDALLADQAELDTRTAYATGLKEASVIRDKLEARLAEVRQRLSRAEHAPTFGLPKPGLGPTLPLPQRFAATREEGELSMARDLWLGSFPLLSRFATNDITGDRVRATLEQIKADIQQARKDLTGEPGHTPTLEPWSLANVRPQVDATLGARAKAVVAAEDTSRKRWGWIKAGASLVLGIALLFLPGGAFLDAAIGVAMAAKSWEEAAALGHASNTSLQVDAGLVTLFQAQMATAMAVLGTVLAVVGAAAQGLRILQKWRTIAAVAGEESGAVTAAGRAGIKSFFLGQGATPTQAQVEALLRRAWSLLRGNPANLPKISVGALTDADGVFKAWVGQFGEITINAAQMSRGQLTGVVFHEALHARMAQWFPRLAGTASNFGLKYKLFAHIDELCAYAFGGAVRLASGATISDRLLGLLEMVMAPWAAYGSLTNWIERAPALVRDMVLVTLYFYELFRFAEARRDAATPRALPAP